MSGEMNETDLSLDYSFDINELVSASGGDIFYAVEGLEDTHEAYVTVTLNTLLAPTFTVYWDWDDSGVSISGLQAMEPGALEILPKRWLRNISNGLNLQLMAKIIFA